MRKASQCLALVVAILTCGLPVVAQAKRKTDLLLRKLRRQEKFGDGISIKEETRRNIQAGQPIAEAVFNYKPPIALTPRKESDVDIDELINPGRPVWTEFRSDEGRFSVLMPQKPVRRRPALTQRRDALSSTRLLHHIPAYLHSWIHRLSQTDTCC